MDQQVKNHIYAHEICSISACTCLCICVYVHICVCMLRSSSLRRKSMLESRQPEQPQLAAAAAAQTKPAQQTDVRM